MNVAKHRKGQPGYTKCAAHGCPHPTGGWTYCEPHWLEMHPSVKETAHSTLSCVMMRHRRPEPRDGPTPCDPPTVAGSVA